MLLGSICSTKFACLLPGRSFKSLGQFRDTERQRGQTTAFTVRISLFSFSDHRKKKEKKTFGLTNFRWMCIPQPWCGWGACGGLESSVNMFRTSKWTATEQDRRTDSYTRVQDGSVVIAATPLFAPHSHVTPKWCATKKNKRKQLKKFKLSVSTLRYPLIALFRLLINAMYIEWPWS